jgi:mannose-6-phosphate isomerase
MRETHEPRTPGAVAVLQTKHRLLSWFLERALPVWDANGIDRRSGGYFETLEPSNGAGGFVASGRVRRGRVVARQIYVFDVARRYGWRSADGDGAVHGAQFLFSRLYAGGGAFHTDLDLESLQPLAPFSLYEQAFYLFALARLRAAHWDVERVDEAALGCLNRLRSSFGRAGGGFEESSPPSLPLKSNPHMHLLEAALEWLEVDAAPGWVLLARELVRLCLTRFSDASNGAIREYFNSDWAPADGEAGRVVEPGHQFEWAWLLMRWARSVHSTEAERLDCVSAAERLVHIGETWGVDPRRRVAINEIWDDMTQKDASAKLWPQTERVKARCAMLDCADTPSRFEDACAGIVIAAEGLLQYLRTDVPGLWYELCDGDGAFAAGPSKASSFYHVVCAIDELCKTSSGPLMSMLYSRPADSPDASW